MNSLVKVFSNFREFYNEINGATLTGAIDVIVVEQPDGEFQCSPFHVRFGKLGVLRSREKVVDIEINGEPVDIHMKLGDSGEAFFVEECLEEDGEELPENMATSPIPSSYFPSKYGNDALEDDILEGTTKIARDDIQLPLPLPRRNSIDFSKETEKEDQVPKFENQVSDFSHRRHTDNLLERRNLTEKLQEYTTQKLRKEWAEHEEIFQFEAVEREKEWINSIPAEGKTQQKPTTTVAPTPAIAIQPPPKEEPASKENNTQSATSLSAPVAPATTESVSNNTSPKDESKGGKKKRRKKSQMKKKNAQRKSSSSSSIGSTTPGEGANGNNTNVDEGDGISISNNTNSSSNEEVATAKSNNDQQSAPLASAIAGDESPISETCQTSPITPSTRIPDLDIHFFSDTEVTPSGGASGCVGRGSGRPSTPIQSDSELEISLREKDVDTELMTNSASWKWGQLPTTEVSDKGDVGGDQSVQSQAQRNSMLSGMFNFMKKTNKMRKQATDGGVYLSDLDAEGMDPEMAALYFPQPLLTKPTSNTTTGSGTAANTLLHSGDDDRESGNGTSLPHSPSSMEGQKSVDSDYEDGKPQDPKYLDFVAMSLCGVSDKGEPSDEEFDHHLIKYSDDAVEQLMANAKQDGVAHKNEPDGATAGVSAQSKRSWWNWRRSQVGATASSTKISKSEDKIDERDSDQAAVATQTTRPNSPDISENTLSKTDSTLNAENTSAQVENLEDLSQASSKGDPSSSNSNKNERYKKSLRLSSEAIKQLNLKDGMNEIEFSVTTAYQGTTRCKCYLFRWNHNDKVVISDIDGTITKSDVLGHILPMVGKDWAQLGVAQLFSKIEQNGYKLLYLSARAIGQSRATREYLRSIRQGDVKLPDGPLLLNPTSLISAFHREVIERKPEQFKIACLSDIRELFPKKDPFYAGYGNRINDVWAYRAVGIPIMRIFTINTKGELKHELTQTFQSSGYINQSLEVDEYFPTLDLNVFEYRTDTFDDDEEEDELQFSETDDGIEDVSVSDGGIEVDADNDDVYLDDYANENVDVAVAVAEEERGLIMLLDGNKVTTTDRRFVETRNTIITTSHTALGANN
ncbi:phosphatidate phosphatase LPIN3 isoform X2 [Anastrepha ludens]|uniref:phosphatidate phosphatase LPIN3 isoform X2 n=1 Tax=Anastrepha ludens TaxID=28586 RepID=UPI0023B03ED8|nr:phosphatidate phosphatase LPIN3 isoform X2 [Anastrepha ludens]